MVELIFINAVSEDVLHQNDLCSLLKLYLLIVKPTKLESLGEF